MIALALLLALGAYVEAHRLDRAVRRRDALPPLVFDVESHVTVIEAT